jgi:plasmid maintenance system antidote protein VapI
MTETEAIQLLKEDVQRSALTVSAYAREIEVPQQSLSAILRGTRPISDRLLTALGLQRQIRRGPHSRL